MRKAKVVLGQTQFGRISVGLNAMRSETTCEKWLSRETVALLLRYSGAVVVAFMVSVLTMFAGSMVFSVGFIPFLSASNPEQSSICFAIAYTAALAGVLSGSLFLTGRDRRLASVALLIIGLGYYLAQNDALTAELPSVFAQPAARHPLLERV